MQNPTDHAAEVFGDTDAMFAETPAKAPTAQVIDMQEERQQRKKKAPAQPKEEREEKSPAELLWKREIMRSGNYAIEEDASGGGIIYEWAKDHWEPVISKTMLERKITPFLEKCGDSYFRAANMASCHKMTEAILFSCAPNLKREKERVLISTRNCLLEVLADGRVRCSPSSRHVLARSHVDVLVPFERIVDGYYVPASDAAIEGRGLLSKLLLDCFPDEATRRCFQEFFGDTFIPTMRKAFPLMIGKPNGGKSQILELLMGLHCYSYGGDLSNLEGFSMEGYLGKTVVVIDEIGKTINEREFKRMVGGSVMVIQRKYQTSLSVRPEFKTFGGCNDMPTLSEKSGAVEARIYPFEIPPFEGEKVDEIAQKIIRGYTEQGTGRKVDSQLLDLLDWAINGAVRVMQRGRLLRGDELPQESLRLKKEMQQQTNPTLAWIEEMGLEPASEHDQLVTKQDAYDAFCEWCEDTGRSGLAKISQVTWARQMFLPAMKELFPDADMKERRINLGGKRPWAYPVRFKYLPSIASVPKTEAERSYQDPASYDPANLPKHIQDLLEAQRARLERELILGKEAMRAEVEADLLAQGYKLENTALGLGYTAPAGSSDDHTAPQL